MTRSIGLFSTNYRERFAPQVRRLKLEAEIDWALKSDMSAPHVKSTDTVYILFGPTKTQFEV